MDKTMGQLLREYRAAVRASAWAEDHGRHGDGRIEDTRAAEQAAVRAVLKAHRDEMSAYRLKILQGQR